MSGSFYYAQFYEYNLANKLSESLGSEGVIELDGRKSLYNQVQDVFDYLEKHKELTKWIVGFKIMYGTFSFSTPKTPYIML